MSHPINLKQAFAHALVTEGIPVKEFAKMHNISPSQFSYWKRNKHHLPLGIKRKILHGWSDPAIPYALFDAHLEDEMEAFNVEYDITFKL